MVFVYKHLVVNRLCFIVLTVIAVKGMRK